MLQWPTGRGAAARAQGQRAQSNCATQVHAAVARNRDGAIVFGHTDRTCKRRLQLEPGEFSPAHDEFKSADDEFRSADDEFRSADGKFKSADGEFKSAHANCK